MTRKFIFKLKNYFSGISKNTVLLAFASLFSDIATEMLYPILPIFLTQNLKASGSIVGLIEGIATATQNIMQGFSGWLSDKLKKRKLVALIGYFFAALSKPLMGFSSLWQNVLAARFLDRASTGIRSAPRDALIASSVTKEHRGKAFGLEGIGDNLGAFLGPLLAIFLLTIVTIDIRHIFYLAFIPAILAFLMILCVKEKVMPLQDSPKLDAQDADKFSKTYWKYLFVTALFSIGNSSNSFLILKTQGVSASLSITIFIYAGFNLIAALISYPAGFLSDRFGRKNILLSAFFIFFITYLGFALFNHIIFIAMLFILYGLYQGIFRTVGKALALDFVPEKFHASGIGWYNATIGFIGLIASIVAGLLWDHVGHDAVFIYGAIFSVVGGIMLIFLVPNK
jgi:MFS family permease